MNRDRERQILSRLVEKGLLDAQVPESLDRHLAVYGVRLGALIDAGRIDEASVRAVESEIGAGISESDSTQPGVEELAETRACDPLERAEGPSLLPAESRFGRYLLGERLGAGGMGEVYRARDRVLERDVAIKFLQGDDPRLVSRFLQEARLQARVGHDNVCEVYEAGEVDGRPYIAMRLIEGHNLAQVDEEMSLEEKVEVMAKVSRAVDAAHQLGLIHRDIKPGNIMVERTPGRHWNPYVMDFGLARDVEGPSTTTTGQTIGTPSYMAPEQAQGLRDEMDRRTDVYGLGATLYHVLSGRPPFDGSGAIEIFLKVIQQDPAPMRRVVPDIPHDLDTIVTKCLEKDPKRRYATAALLAEDLERYLAGEPIQAHPASLAYRTFKKAKKHKSVVAVSMAALICVGTLGIMWLKATWDSSKKARAAQQFGQQVSDVETILRFARMMPLHDTRPEREEARQRLKGIEEQIRQLGAWSEGPGEYVLGRGHLALGEYELAREHLDRSWKLGFRDAGLSGALGRVWGELYRRALGDIRRTGSADERRIRLIETTYRTPALRYLKESGVGRSAESTYVEALIAFYDGRHSEALRLAREASKRTPWLTEATRLEGDIHLAIAGERSNAGDFAGSQSEYEAAGKAYQANIDIDRSDEVAYDREAERWVLMMEEDLRRGASPDAPFSSVLAFADKALGVNPEDAVAYNRRARAYWRWGEYLSSHGQDPREALSKSIEAGEQAVKLDPRDEFANHNVGSAYRELALYEVERGQDPRQSLERSISHLEKATKLNPLPDRSHNNLGLAYQAMADTAAQSGVDPRPTLKKAIDCYANAVAINPRNGLAHNNMGLAYEKLAEYEDLIGVDPSKSLDAAIAALQKAIALNPSSALSFVNLGNVHYVRAGHESEAGEDPRPSVGRAIENYRRAIEIKPDFATSYRNIALVSVIHAGFLLDKGQDPGPALQEGRQAVDRAGAIDRASPVCLQLSGDLEIVAARYAMKQGISPEPHFRKAEAALDRSLKLAPHNLSASQSSAEMHRRRAEWLLHRKQPASNEIAKGIARVAEALTIDSKNALAMALRGALLLEESQTVSGDARLKSARSAAESLARAIETRPGLRHEYEPLLLEAVRLAG